MNKRMAVELTAKIKGIAMEEFAEKRGI